MNSNLTQNNLNTAKTLVIIDSQVDYYQTLIDGILPNIKTCILNNQQDGIQQITNIITQSQNITTIHLIAHGIPGKLFLGNSELSLDNLQKYAEQLKNWFPIKSPENTLNIYGCEVAAGDAGSEFIEKIHDLTKANIYASTKIIGNSGNHQNWELNVKVGKISQAPILPFKNEVLANYQGIFSTGSNGSYVYYDSSDPSGKGSVEFVDISGNGTIVPGGSTTNTDWETIIDLPFNFYFDGTLYQKIMVSENGTITFTNGTTTTDISGTNANLSTGGLNNTIYPYWTNLANGTGNVYKGLDPSDSNRFIIQWNKVKLSTIASEGTFQVILNKDTNRIDFVYSDIDFITTGDQFDYGRVNTTVGIKDDTSYLQYLYNDGTNINNTNQNLLGINSISFYVNDAPVLTDVISSLNFNENFLNASAGEIIDSNITLTNNASVNFNNGNVTVSYTANGTNSDQLGIKTEGLISVSGSNVSYNGIVIGIIDTTNNGSNGKSLVINLNSNSNVSNVEALIEHLTYRNTSDTPLASRTINIAVDDGNSGNNEGVGSANVVINITSENDAPVNSIPTTQIINEDTTLTFSTANNNLISISDPDAGNNNLQVTLTASNGVMTLSQVTGLTFAQDGGDGTNDSFLKFTGTIANINNALNGMTFKPNQNYNSTLGEVKIVLKTEDLGNSVNSGDSTSNLVDEDTINITVNGVNDAPINTIPLNPLSVNEDTELLINTLSITDIDADETPSPNNLIQLTLSVSNGTLKFADQSLANLLTFADGNNNNGNAGMTVTGTLANLNNALNAGIIYKGSQNFNGDDTLTMRTNDLGNAGSGGAKLDEDSVTITVNQVNDTPVVTVSNTSQTVNEDTELTVTGISISDVDIDTNVNKQSFTDLQLVTLTVTKGILKLGTTTDLTVTNNGTKTVTIQGTIANLNTALATLTYKAYQDFNGQDILTITTDDLGNSGIIIDGAEGATSLTDTKTINININPIDDSPVNILPLYQDADTALPFILSEANHNALFIKSVDVDHTGGAKHQVTLTVANGTLKFEDTSKISFVTGSDNSGKTTITFTGTIPEINHTLAQGLIYTSNTGFKGQENLNITTVKLNSSDQPISGIQDQDTINILVRDPNYTPEVVVRSQSFDPVNSRNIGFTKNNGGWITQNDFPRMLADVNGDGKADIVGFGSTNVIIRLGNGNGSFQSAISQNMGFTKNSGGWITQNDFPRMLADVNGDGFADIVGFGSTNVIIRLGNGNGSFQSAISQNLGFTKNSGGWITQNDFPRMLADVNGDGYADIVGFGSTNVIIRLGNGNGTFKSAISQNLGFTKNNGGWSNQNDFPRMLADVNGDGYADIVGFGNSAVLVALSNGDGTFQPAKAQTNISFAKSNGGWITQDDFPRMLGDINGDGKADIMGFGNTSVVTSLSSFKPDLQATYFNVVNESLNKGDAVNLEFNVHNSGDKNANSILVHFYLSQDNNITSSDYLLGSYTINSLNQNANTGKLSQTFTLPNNSFWTDSNTYHIGMLIDPNNTINEWNETNNGNNKLAGIDFDTIALNTPKPDLLIPNGDASVSVSDNGDILLNVKVTNNSNVTASHSNVRYWLSDDQILDDGDLYLGDDYIPELAPNSSYDQSFTVTDEVSLGSGQKYIIFEVDPFEKVLETDKSNNLASVQISVGG